ncbi:MAG: hypothetical protein ACR2PF_05105, partial [Rhizobiaceae bacterium]
KAFDVIAAALLIGLCLWAIPVLFSEFTEVEGSLKMPLKWRIGVGLVLLISIGIVLYGLIKDFNKTPAEHVELDEIEEEAALLKETNAPDEVLTGNPPPVDAASGKIEGDR